MLIMSPYFSVACLTWELDFEALSDDEHVLYRCESQSAE